MAICTACGEVKQTPPRCVHGKKPTNCHGACLNRRIKEDGSACERPKTSTKKTIAEIRSRRTAYLPTTSTEHHQNILPLHVSNLRPEHRHYLLAALGLPQATTALQPKDIPQFRMQDLPVELQLHFLYILDYKTLMTCKPRTNISEISLPRSTSPLSSSHMKKKLRQSCKENTDHEGG